MMIIALCAAIALLPLVYVLWWYAATQSHAATFHKVVPADRL